MTAGRACRGRVATLGAVVLAVSALAVGSSGSGAAASPGSPSPTPTVAETQSPEPEPTLSSQPTPSKTPPEPTPAEPSGKPSAGERPEHGQPVPSPDSVPKKPTKKKPSKKPPKKSELADVPQAHSWAEQGITKLGVRGIDVSAWEHPDGAEIDWKRLRADGVKWMYTKCSDGVDGHGDYTRWGPIDVRAAESAGVVSGCYHYAQPHADGDGNTTSDALTQARAAVAIEPKNPTPTLPLALDLEETLDLSDTQLGDWTKTFLAEVARLTGRTPWMYASQYYLSDHLAERADLAPYPIWVAAYSLTARRAPPVPAWANRVAWQFSSAGQLDGIPTDTVDLDVFIGPPELLRRPQPVVSPPAGAGSRPLAMPTLPDVIGLANLPNHACPPSLGELAASPTPLPFGAATRVVFIDSACY